MPSAILFDNDGTLVDTEGLFYEACAEILAHYGATLTPEWYTDHVMKYHGSCFDLLDRTRYTPEAIQRIRAERNALYQQKLKGRVEHFPEAIAVTRYLSEKYPLALVTSSERAHLNLILDQVPLRGYFRVTLAWEDVANRKPHPEPYLKAAAALAVPPGECLVIEDSERGLASAKAAGMSCYVIPNRHSAGNDFSAADRVLSGLPELLRLL